jgi:hypothetical protein
LGRYGEANDAYQETLQRDPNNSIAQKQTKRLALLVEESQGARRPRTSWTRSC